MAASTIRVLNDVLFRSRPEHWADVGHFGRKRGVVLVVNDNMSLAEYIERVEAKVKPWNVTVKDVRYGTVEYSAGKCYLVELRDVRGVFKTVFGHAMVEQGIKGQQHSGNQQTLKELGFQTGSVLRLRFAHKHRAQKNEAIGPSGGVRRNRSQRNRHSSKSNCNRSHCLMCRLM